MSPISRSYAWLAAAGALSCAFAPVASAEIYKWVDAQGVVNYSSSPPPNSRVQTIREDQISVVPSSHISAEEAQALSDRIAARRNIEAQAIAAESIAPSSATSTQRVIEDPVYYPRPASYPTYGRRVSATPGLDYELRPGPYGIGAQPAPSQRAPRYRELPSRTN